MLFQRITVLRVLDTVMLAGNQQRGKDIQDILSTRHAFLVSEALTDEKGLDLLRSFLSPLLTRPGFVGLF